MSPQQSINHDKALAFLSTISAQDGQANLALRTPDCQHTILPASTGFPPDISNEKWLDNLNNMNSVLSTFKLTPIDLMETDRQVAISAEGLLEVRPELRDEEHEQWSLSSQLIFVLQFNEAGKIVKVLEMLDSEAAKHFFPVMGRAGENLKNLQAKQ